MNILKLLTAIPVIASEIDKAIKDRVVTIQEIVNIIDDSLKVTTGKGLNDIGLKITKTETGKTKIEFFV